MTGALALRSRIFLGQAASRLGWLGWVSVAIAALVLAPLAAVVSNVFLPGATTWAHLAATVLPEYLVNTLLLVLLVAGGVIFFGVLSAWLVTAYSFPGAAFARVGAGFAAGHAGLRHGVRLHRLAAGCRAGADRAARDYRLAGTRVLVSGDPFAARGGCDAFLSALPLRLSARAQRLSRSNANHS